MSLNTIPIHISITRIYVLVSERLRSTEQMMVKTEQSKPKKTTTEGLEPAAKRQTTVGFILAFVFILCRPGGLYPTCQEYADLQPAYA